MNRATTIEQVKAAEKRWMLGAINDVPTELGWTAAEYEAYQETGSIPAIEFKAGGHIDGSSAPPVSAVLGGVNWTPEMIAKLSPEQRKLMGFAPESTPEAQSTEILHDEPELMPESAAPAPAPKKKRAPRKPKGDGMAGKRKESRVIIERKKLEPGTQVSVSWGLDDKDGHRTVTHTGTVKEIDDEFLTIEPCTTPNGHLRIALISPSAIGRIINLDSPEEPTEYRPDRWWLAPHHKKWHWRPAKGDSSLLEIRSETTGELAPEPNTFAAKAQYRDAMDRAHKLNNQERDKFLAMPERPKEDR